jgi:hypothetical protein
MRENPERAAFGGKVLPIYQVPPPGWLTPEKWSPTGVADLGEQKFVVGRHRQLCFMAGTLRRDDVRELGGSTPHFSRAPHPSALRSDAKSPPPDTCVHAVVVVGQPRQLRAESPPETSFFVQKRQLSMQSESGPDLARRRASAAFQKYLSPGYDARNAPSTRAPPAPSARCRGSSRRWPFRTLLPVTFSAPHQIDLISFSRGRTSVLPFPATRPRCGSPPPRHGDCRWPAEFSRRWSLPPRSS